WFILDGFRVTGNTGGAGCINGGSHDGAASSLFHDVVFRHIESFGNCGLGGIAAFNGIVNATIEYGVFHGNTMCLTCQHGVYWGSRALASSNVKYRRSIAYGNGEGGYNGFTFNGRCMGCTFEQLIFYNNGGSGLMMEMGVKDSFIR